MLDTPATANVGYLFTLSYLNQLFGDARRLQDALLGSVGTIISLATGVRDEKELGLEFPKDQIERSLFALDMFEACMRSSLGHSETGRKIKRFYLKDLAYPIYKNAITQIHHLSQEKYTRKRKHVETQIV